MHQDRARPRRPQRVPREVVRLAPLPLLLLLAATVLLAWPQVTPAAADGTTLAELRRRYEAALTRRAAGDYRHQEEALAAIAGTRSDEGRALLHELLARYGRMDRKSASLLLGALVRYGRAREVDAAIDWVEEQQDPLLLDLLHRALGEVRLPSTKAYLRGDALRAAAPRVKAQIVRALGASKDREALASLMEAARQEHLLVRTEALEALGLLQDRRALPLLQVFLRHEDLNVRDAAARGLGHLREPMARAALERALGDKASRVAESAARGLARLDDPAAVPALLRALERAHGKDLRLGDAITEALQSISGKSIHADPELWRAWWAAMQGKPFRKEDGPRKPPTVPGPSYYGFPVRSSRVIFVLDVSRSMGWNGRLESAKQELVQVLGNLPPSTRFNLVVYSDQAWPWREGLQEATSATVKRAIAFVRSQRALRGTNTHAALAAAFDDPHVDTVFFLSDGHPSVGRVVDPDLILGQVREWNRYRRVRIHGIALLRGEPPAAFASQEDSERSESFMRGLTNRNDGHCKVVR